MLCNKIFAHLNHILTVFAASAPTCAESLVIFYFYICMDQIFKCLLDLHFGKSGICHMLICLQDHLDFDLPACFRCNDLLEYFCFLRIIDISLSQKIRKYDIKRTIFFFCIKFRNGTCQNHTETP